MAIRLVKFLNSPYLLLVLPIKHAFMSFVFITVNTFFLIKIVDTSLLLRRLLMRLLKEK